MSGLIVKGGLPIIRADFIEGMEFMGVLGKRKAPWTVDSLARKLAFWHGQRISHEGKTVAYWNGGGNFGDAPERYSERHWQDYTAASEMVLRDLYKRKK